MRGRHEAFPSQLLPVEMIDKRPVISLGRGFRQGMPRRMEEQQLGSEFVSPRDFAGGGL